MFNKKGEGRYGRQEINARNMARWIFANMTFKFGQLIVCNLHRNSNPEPALIGLCYVYIYIYNSRERKFLNYVNGGGCIWISLTTFWKIDLPFKLIIKIFLIRIPILFGSKKSIWNTRNKKKKYPSFMQWKNSPASSSVNSDLPTTLDSAN